MRTSMNLRALMRGTVNENVNLGDNVEVEGENGEKREGVVKVADGPGETTGVLIDGELEMVPTDDVKRKTEEDCDDNEDCSDDEQLNEGVLGMTIMPSLERMQQLAGIRVEAFDFAQKDEDESEDAEASSEETDEAETETEEQVDCETADCEEPENCEDKADCDEATEEDREAVVVAVEPADTAPVEAPVDPAVAANHPATAGEVTMMSAPVDPDPMPDAEEAPTATPTQSCFDAVAQIEQELPNIPVKDFAEVRKRMQNVLNSLLEGSEGRARKL